MMTATPTLDLKMLPPDAIARLVGVLRRRRTDDTQRPDAAASSASSASGKTAASAPPVTTDLQEVVRQRLQRIDPADPNRQSKLMTAFLETVLLREFGESLQGDPAFHALLTDLCILLQNDDALRRDFTAMLNSIMT